MTKIQIKECVYSIHPIYDLYAADQNGKIIHILKKVPMIGNERSSGYMQCSVSSYGKRKKRMFVHRFIWECYNGVIPDGKVIDHINNDRKDNRLCNLQMLTQQQNCKKSAKNRDYKFAAKNHENRKCVEATNLDTNEVVYFYSLYAVQQHLEINAGIVKMVCEGLNNCKSGLSKINNCNYTFEYVKEEDLPNDHFKSANKKPKRVSDEDKKKLQAEATKKWAKKEYQCPRCDRVYKNGYKFHHNKHCK